MLRVLLIGDSKRSRIHEQILVGLGCICYIIGARNFLRSAADFSPYHWIVISAAWDMNDEVLKLVLELLAENEGSVRKVFVEKPIVKPETIEFIHNCKQDVAILFDRRFSQTVLEIIEFVRSGQTVELVDVSFSDNVSEKRSRLGVQGYDWLFIFFVHVVDALNYIFRNLRVESIFRQGSSWCVCMSSELGPDHIMLRFLNDSQSETIFTVGVDGIVKRWRGFENESGAKRRSLEALWHSEIGGVNDVETVEVSLHSLRLVIDIVKWFDEF